MGQKFHTESKTVTHVTVGAGADLNAYIERNLGRGPAGEWPVPKTAQVNELVVILVPALHGKFHAFGRVATAPASGKWGNKKQYFSKIDDLHVITPAVPVLFLKDELPDWGWASYPRSYTTVPEHFRASFWAFLANHPIAKDIDDPPDRKTCEITRIVRDTAAARELKARYDYRCQVCNAVLQLGNGKRYVEVHHLRPLGNPHCGLDNEKNMLVLCPNDHALFDFGVPQFEDASTVRIGTKQVKLRQKHTLSTANIDYYKTNICETNPGA
jgi:hypothetical protein